MSGKQGRHSDVPASTQAQGIKSKNEKCCPIRKPTVSCLDVVELLYEYFKNVYTPTKPNSRPLSFPKVNFQTSGNEQTKKSVIKLF